METHPTQEVRTVVERMAWHESVRNAICRYAERHKSRIFTRQGLIQEELERIVAETQSEGQTPPQTLSRVLQKLRDEGFIYFQDDRGAYLLVSQAANVPALDLDEVDLTDDQLDAAFRHNDRHNVVMHLQDVPAADQAVSARRRRGQDRLRAMTLSNYGHVCALCDINDVSLLRTSHIVPWAQDIESRGILRNILCLCAVHDSLLEQGYISLSDDHVLLKKDGRGSHMMETILNATRAFRLPRDHRHCPDAAFLARHRLRHGFK